VSKVSTLLGTRICEGFQGVQEWRGGGQEDAGHRVNLDEAIKGSIESVMRKGIGYQQEGVPSRTTLRGRERTALQGGCPAGGPRMKDLGKAKELISARLDDTKVDQKRLSVTGRTVREVKV